MTSTQIRSLIVETVLRYGECTVSPDLARIAFPSTPPILTLALAVGGHRDATTPDEQLRQFAEANGLRYHMPPDGFGRLDFAGTRDVAQDTNRTIRLRVGLGSLGCDIVAPDRPRRFAELMTALKTWSDKPASKQAKKTRARYGKTKPKEGGK